MAMWSCRFSSFMAFYGTLGHKSAVKTLSYDLNFHGRYRLRDGKTQPSVKDVAKP